MRNQVSQVFIIDLVWKKSPRCFLQPVCSANIFLDATVAEHIFILTADFWPTVKVNLHLHNGVS